MRIRILTLSALIAVTTAPSWAANKGVAPADDISTPARKAPAQSTSATVKKPAPAPGERVLWDSWYTVTVNKVVHYEYYNDRAEIKKGRVLFQNHAWKKEEDYINEEQLGVFAEAVPELTPLFFNFHSTYRSVETTIDANAKDGKELTVRVRKGETELPIIKKSIPSKTFFSELFPVWLGYRLASFRPGQVYSFQTILEDNLEAEFGTINGQVRVEPADEIALKTKTTKVMVNYREMKSVWWVEPNGSPVRIEMPLQKTVVDRVSAETAKKFLAGS
jgi:hypothetical protein